MNTFTPTCNMQHATCNMQHATCNKKGNKLVNFLAALAFIFASSLAIHQSAAAYCPGRFEVLDSGECPTTKVCPDNSQILFTEQCPVLATGATKKCEDGSRVAKIADCPLYKDRNSIFLRESSPIISSLVDGADINIANSYGNTPLHMVSGREASSVLVSVLLELGANINARDRDGDLPFHLAAINGNTDIMKMLVARSNNISAYINSPGRRDSTPLHLATEAHQPESIALLLQLGVDITATNNRRMTALQIAQERNYVSLIPLLQSAESTPTNPLPAATSSSSNSGKVLGIAAGAAAIAAAWWFFNKDDSDFSWTPSYSFANNNGNMSYSLGSRWTATANDWQIYWQTRQTDKFVYGSGISYNNGILSAAMNSESEGNKTDLDLNLSANKTVGLWDFGGGYNFDMQISDTDTETKTETQNRINAKIRYTMDKWILSANANTDGNTGTARINYSYRF